MKLVRNLKTETVHRPDCGSHGKDAAPWHWATTRTLDEVKAETASNPWLHLCRTCLPGCCSCNRCREAPACQNDVDHAARKPAVATLTWPDGRFKPFTACIACVGRAVLQSVDGTHGALHPVLVTPLPTEAARA